MSEQARSRRPGRRSALSAIAGVLALAAAWLPAQAVQAAIPAAPAEAAVPVLAWTDCGGGFQCATASVPLDYDRPRGDTISLALTRLPAADQAHRIGSLLVNPGGPGGSGVAFVQGDSFLFPAELRDRFDLVGFDPRGIGRSTPVRCFQSQAEQAAFFAGLPAFPVTPAEERTTIQADREFDRLCAERNARLLPHMSTANAARDMDLLRRALGDSKLSYLGLSYGTYLGTTYANLFPDRVRALVLDGAVEPVGWATGRDDQGERVPTFLRIGSHLGSSQTLGAFLRLCAGAGPARCPFAAGMDPEATADRFQALMARLRERPLPVPTPQGTFEVTYALTVVVVLAVLYFQVGWPALAVALDRLDQGDASVLLQLLAIVAPPSPTYDNSYDALESVVCADSDSPRNPFAWPAAARAADRRAPYFGSRWAYVSLPCAEWRARDEDRYTGPFGRRTANPVLVVGNTFDPATRYESAVALSHELGSARLLTLDGFGHTAFVNPSTCAHEAETRYLVDLALPARGTVCRPDAGPFDQTPAPGQAAAAARALPALPGLPAPLGVG